MSRPIFQGNKGSIWYVEKFSKLKTCAIQKKHLKKVKRQVAVYLQSTDLINYLHLDI